MNLTDPKIRRVIMAELGRSGGKKRAERLGADARKQIAQAAANARWSEYFARHPERRGTHSKIN